jgi:tetratricopeptide (TPR) repeat protein
MSPSDYPGSLLKEGIQAARDGRKADARRLLLQVVEQDERNEMAWLWLSGVVESDDDRLICLENVLAINPDNGPAKKGLARLNAAESRAESAADTPPPEIPEVVDNVVRVERPPISAAAAVLYPERQIMELPWDERTDLQTIPAVTYEAHSKYDDIWQKETEICAYCAHEVAYDDSNCPQCKRKLSISQFVYPKYSPDLVVYFVLLLGTSQLFFVHALVDLIVEAPLLSVVWDILLFLVLFVLSGAIVMRQFWAYTASVFILILIFLSRVFDILTSMNESGLAIPIDGVAFFEAMAESGFIALISPVLEYLIPFQMLAIFLALLYGIFKAGPDFERVKTRLVARVERDLRDGSAFYAAGKMFAKEGMWASAVLHFQRAAAHEPTRAYYHLTTGKAFAQLGFVERAMDAFSNARRLTTNPELKTEIDLAIDDIKGN